MAVAINKLALLLAETPENMGIQPDLKAIVEACEIKAGRFW